MNKEYIDKHEAYLLLKRKAEIYALPATKEAYEKAAVLIDSMKTHEVQPVEQNDWISVKDRLPEPNTRVLVYAKQGSYMNLRIDHICNGRWFYSIMVTHWMPLPGPPAPRKPISSIKRG